LTISTLIDISNAFLTDNYEYWLKKVKKLG
jgi:hypothetical protein